MANELFLPYGVTGQTVYASVRRPADGQRWYTITPTWETYNPAHIANGYAIAMTEEGTDGNYLGSFPAGITSVGVYQIVYRRQAGGSPAWPGDPIVAIEELSWSGVAVNVPVVPNGTGQTTVATNNDKSGYSLSGLPAVPTDWLAAAGIKADAVTKIQAGLSTYTGTDTTGTATLLTRIPGTVQPQSGDAFARIGTAGAGLTALGDSRINFLDAPISGRMATFSYTTPPTTAQIAAAILATPSNLLVTDTSGHVALNLTQAVPTSNTAQTVGDAFNAARAQGFGKWALDAAANTLTLYGPDGSTAVRTFTLQTTVNPTTRT